MTDRIASRVNRWLWLPIVAFVVFILAYGLVLGGGGGGGGSDTGTWANELAYVAFLLSFSSVGALVAAKRPGNPIGWLMLSSAVCYALGGLGISVEASSAGSRFSVAILTQWVGGWAWGVGLGLAVVTLLVFPDGRLPSRRWRPVLWLAVAGIAAFVLGLGFGERFIGGGHVPNPFAVPGPVGNALRALQDAFPLVLLTALLAVASIVVRFRRSRGIEREQVKWLLYAALLVGLGILASVPISLLMSSSEAANNASNAVGSATLAFVPVAIGIAVLRYRLYDIDRIINRTLVYGSVTILLGGVYAALAVGLGSIAGRSDSLVIAGSTLVVAGLFRPARRRIQAFIDRRFYRRRYDAAKTLQAFSGRLRDEIDLEELRQHLLSVAGETMQPTRASVWLRRQAPDGQAVLRTWPPAGKPRVGRSSKTQPSNGSERSESRRG